MKTVLRAVRLSGLAAIAAATWLLGANPGLAAPKGDQKPKPPAATTCVEVRTSAPYRGYGYDHIVELRNGCTRTVTCHVKTDVNPEPVDQEIPAGETREVVTFVGSPSAVFVPKVDCSF